MRTPRTALVVAVAVALLAAGTADARIAAHGQQKLAVMTGSGVDPHPLPLKCEDVWISSVNRSWATVYPAGNRKGPFCPKYAYNDQWFLHRVGGKWRGVSAGDLFMCPRPHGAPGVPYRILRDLIGCG